mgnify:CR=1 FL=1
MMRINKKLNIFLVSWFLPLERQQRFDCILRDFIRWWGRLWKGRRACYIHLLVQWSELLLVDLLVVSPIGWWRPQVVIEMSRSFHWKEWWYKRRNVFNYLSKNYFAILPVADKTWPKQLVRQGHTRVFLDLLSSMGLKQRVNVQTHMHQWPHPWSIYWSHLSTILLLSLVNPFLTASSRIRLLLFVH